MVVEPGANDFVIYVAIGLISGNYDPAPYGAVLKNSPK